MRITGGALRGRRLLAPRGATRPTSERTREALFNLLAARTDLGGARVLDLFAGSGALGLEALSRGAAHATFAERARPALAAIRSNVASLGLEAQCTILRADALRILAAPAPAFDLILADPPYGFGEMARLPALALARLEPGGFFVLEHDRTHDFEGHPALETSRRYGQSALSLFREPEGRRV